MSVQPPSASGHPPPSYAVLGGRRVDLLPLAEEICRRYRSEFADERERYGDAGHAWCVHDNRHILNWTAEAVAYGADLEANLLWLRRVLVARDFPVERLVRDLEIAADVLADAAQPEPAARLRAAAVVVARGAA